MLCYHNVPVRYFPKVVLLNVTLNVLVSQCSSSKYAVCQCPAECWTSWTFQSDIRHFFKCHVECSASSTFDVWSLSKPSWMFCQFIIPAWHSSFFNVALDIVLSQCSSSEFAVCQCLAECFSSSTSKTFSATLKSWNVESAQHSARHSKTVNAANIELGRRASSTFQHNINLFFNVTLNVLLAQSSRFAIYKI